MEQEDENLIAEGAFRSACRIVPVIRGEDGHLQVDAQAVVTAIAAVSNVASTHPGLEKAAAALIERFEKSDGSVLYAPSGRGIGAGAVILAEESVMKQGVDVAGIVYDEAFCLDHLGFPPVWRGPSSPSRTPGM